MEGSYVLDANSLYNELLLGLRRGDLITRETRQRSADAMAGKERAGQSALMRITWVDRAPLSSRHAFRLLVSTSVQDHLGIRFTPDAYGLTFFGNAPYEDNTASLSGCGLEQQRFRTLGAGLHLPASGSWLRLDLVLGRSLSAIRLDEADLYTAPDGRLLDARVKGSWARSDTTPLGFWDADGVGASISMAHTWRLGPGHDDRHTIHLRVDDLGMIRWNAASARATKDTTLLFEGIRVENLFDLPELALGRDQVLDTLGLALTPGAFWRMMPFQALLRQDVRVAHAWTAAWQLSQRALLGHAPMVQVEGGRLLGQRGGVMAATLRYGGLGGLRVGLRGTVPVGGRLLTHMEIPNITGLLGGASARGLAAGVVVEWRW